MSIRVHDLAKRCGLSSKEMIEKLKTMNYPVKSASSTVDNISAEAIEKEYGYVAAPTAPVKAEAAPVVVAPPPLPPVVAPPAPVVAIQEPVVPPPAPPQETPPPPAPVSIPVPPPEKPVISTSPYFRSLPKPLVPAPANFTDQRPTPIRPSKTPPAPTPAPAPVAKPVPVAPPAPKPVVKPQAPRPPVAPPAPFTGPLFTVNDAGQKVITMKPPIVVRDLAQRLSKKPHLLLADLMELNVFANLNETIGEDAARKICERSGYVFELEKRERGAYAIHTPKPAATPPPGVNTEDLQPRPPVVTVMGHVDHGKTSLLDAIRKTDVAGHESGGITQHIGASIVRLPDGKQISFLDTPGHAAFTKMRSRGANVTDIVVLVVGADDGVMPQTLEALNHARAAKVPIIVAVNKCDLPTANPDRVKKQLQEHGLNPESWGGDTITVDVSAKSKKNLDLLLEMILLQADILELRASSKAIAKGNVIEAQVEPGLGPTATVLVRQGILKIGDAVIVGPHGGKIRALIDDKGKRVKEAGPSIPVKIVGLSGLPEAGAEFTVMKNEKEARELSEQRILEARVQSAAEPKRTSLENLMSQLGAGEKKKLNIILKTDVQGSLEAIADSLGKLKSDKIEMELIHAAVGSITENDVLLATASHAVLFGFRVKTESGVTDMAAHEGVQIKLYTIIYELLEQVEEALTGLLEPDAKEMIVGHAEIRKVFELSNGPKVAGCYVTDGRITRTGRVRLLRRRVAQYEGRIGSLKHFQDDAKEVKAGGECGLRLENFQDYQAGDVIECYTVEKVAASL